MRKLIALGLLAVLALGSSGAFAAKPQLAEWHGPVWRSTEGGVVEQQSPYPYWIRTPYSTINPDWLLDDGCAWDADDQLWAGLGGALGAGQTASGSLCVYADWSRHLVALAVHTTGLRGTLTLPGHASLTIEAGEVACITSPSYAFWQRGTSGNPGQALEEWSFSPLLTTMVPGSNDGGFAERTTFTYAVTNITGRRIRSVSAEVELVLAGFEFVAAPTGCPFPIFEAGAGRELYPIGADPQVWTWTGEG